ncbi:MAG TPA: hypothetical protein VNM39_13310 [Verrucomicrobiae bacterium]|nr:hypothetical protein [Verrucomicrobiae bacterium]
MSFHDEEPITRAGRPRPPLRAVEEVLPDDPQELLGKVMRAVVKLQLDVDELKTLPSEVRHLREEIQQDRGALVKGASMHAAKRAGNRLAVIMTGVFTLYEFAAPMLRAFWKALGK